MMQLKRIIPFAVALCVIVAGCYWLASARADTPQDRFLPVAVERGTIEDVITAQGKLEAKEYVDVGTQVSGQVKAIHVDIGDTVRSGQLLAEIDPRVYQSQVEANQAKLNSLRAQLLEQRAQFKLAEQALVRNNTLFDANAVSQQVLQESEAQGAVAQARVTATQAQIEEVASTLSGIRTNLEFTKIHAPMAGTVTTLPAREGQTLNANQTAPLLMQIADLDTMTVRAQVAEADVTRLREGMHAYFTTLGDSERRWQGTVRQILPSPDVVNDVVLYNVLIDVPNKDRQLMTGMSTQVFFVLGKAEGVAVIPFEALGRRVPESDDPSGKAYSVRVLKKGKGAAPEDLVIHTGLLTRTQAEVTAGLSGGERVLVKRPVASAPPGGRPGGPGGFGGGGFGGPRGFGGGPRL